MPKFDKDGNPLSKSEQKRLIKQMKKEKEQAEKAAKDRSKFYLFPEILFKFLFKIYSIFSKKYF